MRAVSFSGVGQHPLLTWYDPNMREEKGARIKNSGQYIFLLTLIQKYVLLLRGIRHAYGKSMHSSCCSLRVS